MSALYANRATLQTQPSVKNAAFAWQHQQEFLAQNTKAQKRNLVLLDDAGKPLAPTILLLRLKAEKDTSLFANPHNSMMKGVQ